VKKRTALKVMMILLASVGALALIIVIIAVIAVAHSGSSSVAADPRPQNEQAFLHIVSAAETDGSTNNQIRQDEVRTQRGASLCQQVFQNGVSVSSWIGTVKAVRTSSVDGKASLQVDVTDSVTLETDDEGFLLRILGTDPTLIPKGSVIYNTLADTAIGDKVQFFGSFVRATNNDCVVEKSVTTQGSLSQPEYLFQFASLNRMNQN
jgi:hypothetical protein